jgi:hypothetical protein
LIANSITAPNKVTPGHTHIPKTTEEKKMASMEKVLLQPRMKWADMKSEVDIHLYLSII